MLLKPPQIYRDLSKGGEIKEEDGNKIELESCIKNFASPEVLRGQNQRFCKTC